MEARQHRAQVEAERDATTAHLNEGLPAESERQEAARRRKAEWEATHTVYQGWESVPEGLYTRTQLKKERLYLSQKS